MSLLVARRMAAVNEPPMRAPTQRPGESLSDKEQACWRLIVQRLPLAARAQLACASKALAQLALAEITCSGAADVRLLAGSETAACERSKRASENLLALVRRAGSALLRLRIFAGSTDLDLDQLVAALGGASALQELVVAPAPTCDAAIAGGAPAPPESAFAGVYDCWKCKAASVAQLYAAHPQLSRAVLTVMASTLAASPEVGRLPGAELTLLSFDALNLNQYGGLGTFPTKEWRINNVLSLALLIEVLSSGGFRTVCVHVSPSPPETAPARGAGRKPAAPPAEAAAPPAADDPLAGLAVALLSSKVERLSLTVRGQTDQRQRVMRPIWAALRGGWAPAALRFGCVRGGDIAYADADAAAADAAPGGSPLGPAEFEISTGGDDQSEFFPNSQAPLAAADGTALRPYLSATRRRLRLSVPDDFFAALFSESPAPPPFQATLEGLALKHLKGEAAAVLLQRLTVLRHLDVGSLNGDLAPLLEAALASGRPLSSLRVGRALPVLVLKLGKAKSEWRVNSVDDEEEAAAVAARLVDAGRLDVLELGLSFSSSKVSNVIGPLVEALRDCPGGCCGLRPGSAFRFGVDCEFEGDSMERLTQCNLAFEVAAPSGGGAGGDRLVVHEMYFTNDLIAHDYEDRAAHPGDIFGTCLELLTELAQAQPLVRRVDVACGEELTWHELKRMGKALGTAAVERPGGSLWSCGAGPSCWTRWTTQARRRSGGGERGGCSSRRRGPAGQFGARPRRRTTWSGC